MRHGWSSRISVLIRCVLFVSCGAIAPRAMTGDWKLDDSFTSGLTWSSNPGREDSGDENGDLFLTVSPSFTLRGKGRRLSADIAYRPSFDQKLSGGSDSGLSNLLDATADIEAVEDHLFVNVRASAGLTVRSGRTSNLGVDGISNVSGGESDQTYTLAVSPEWRNRFGSFADNRVRTRFDVVESGSGATSNSTAGQIDWLLSSGRDFPRFPWSLNLSTNRVSFDSRDNDRRTSLTGQISYSYSRHSLLRANAGVEDNDVDSSRSDTDGFIWGLGGTLTPNVRTNLDVNWGNRYFGSTWDVRFSHRTKRTTLTANLSRTVSNARNTLLDRQFIDPVTGNTNTSSLPRLSDEDFLEESADVGIALQGKRTQADIRVGWSQRESETSGDKEDTLEFDFGISRRLGAQISADFSLSWQNKSDDGNDDSETFLSSFGLSKAIGRSSSIGVKVSHRNEDEGSDDSSTENRIAINFTTSLL